MNAITGPVRKLRANQTLITVFGHTYGGTPGCKDVYAEIRQRIGTRNYTEVRLCDAPRPFDDQESARRWLRNTLEALPIGTFFDQEPEGHGEPEELCELCQTEA